MTNRIQTWSFVIVTSLSPACLCNGARAYADAKIFISSFIHITQICLSACLSVQNPSSTPVISDRRDSSLMTPSAPRIPQDLRLLNSELSIQHPSREPQNFHQVKGVNAWACSIKQWIDKEPKLPKSETKPTAVWISSYQLWLMRMVDTAWPAWHACPLWEQWLLTKIFNHERTNM